MRWVLWRSAQALLWTLITNLIKWHQFQKWKQAIHSKNHSLTCCLFSIFSFIRTWMHFNVYLYKSHEATCIWRLWNAPIKLPQRKMTALASTCTRKIFTCCRTVIDILPVHFSFLEITDPRHRFTFPLPCYTPNDSISIGQDVPGQQELTYTGTGTPGGTYRSTMKQLCCIT